VTKKLTVGEGDDMPPLPVKVRNNSGTPGGWPTAADAGRRPRIRLPLPCSPAAAASPPRLSATTSGGGVMVAAARRRCGCPPTPHPAASPLPPPPDRARGHTLCPRRQRRCGWQGTIAGWRERGGKGERRGREGEGRGEEGWRPPGDEQPRRQRGGGGVAAALPAPPHRAPGGVDAAAADGPRVHGGRTPRGRIEREVEGRGEDRGSRSHAWGSGRATGARAPSRRPRNPAGVWRSDGAGGGCSSSSWRRGGRRKASPGGRKRGIGRGAGGGGGGRGGDGRRGGGRWGDRGRAHGHGGHDRLIVSGHARVHRQVCIVAGASVTLRGSWGHHNVAPRSGLRGPPGASAC